MNSKYSRNSPHIHSTGNQHLEGMMEGELFSDEVVHLFKNQGRNVASFKRKLEREKEKIALVVQQMKREVIHHLDDVKISLQAELDQLYRGYMDKYARLRREVAAVTRLRDEAGVGLSMRTSLHHSEDSLALNGPMIRSLNRTNMEVKQAHMLAYISQIQRDRANVLSALSNQLVVLTNYQEGYFRSGEFQRQGDEWLEEVKFSLRALLARKEEYIRQLKMVEQPILKGVYQQQSPLNNTSYRGQPQQLRSGVVSSLPVEQYQHHQSLCVDRGEVITLQTLPPLISQSADIVLCAIGVGGDQVAVGSKDGLISIYEVSSGNRVAVLQAHKASICKLALINRRGKTWLASGSDLGCSSISLWDTQTWTQQLHLFSHKAAVTSLADLLDGRSLISGSYDRSIHVYDLDQQGQLVFTLTANKAAVSEIVISCDGGRAVSCGLDDSLQVWQIVRAGRTVETMFLERIIQNNTMICSLIASAIQPALVFLGTKDGRVKMVSLDRGQAYKTIICCTGAIIQLAVVQRRSKPTLPMVLCWPCGQQSLKIINSESGNATSIDTQGSMQFSCGLGPKGFFLPTRGPTLAVLSQNPRQRQVNLFQISMN